MTLYKNAVAVCLLAGLITPLRSQLKAQPGEGITPKKICPKGFKCINLCELALQIKPRKETSNASSTRKSIQMETVEPQKDYSLLIHDDYSLSYPDKEEFIWTCTDPKTNVPQSFRIKSIEKIWNPSDPCDPAVPSAPQFPFDPRLNPSLFKLQEKLPLPGKPVELRSGAPVKAAQGQWYKFSFIAYIGNNPIEIDPHFIVTPVPGDGYRRPHCLHPHPGPH